MSNLLTNEVSEGTPVPKRAPSKVMRLDRLGSFHQSRLSFMRVLTRRCNEEGWRFEQTQFDINSRGVGHAVYQATGPDRCYSLIAFAHDLPDELRSDRVIAEQWDATFVLFDGIPTKQDITRLEANVPHQESGRITKTELTLSRANRSVRLWEHVVDCLAAGRQPETDQINSVGYLMRTTAVYGSGKFGAADRQSIAHRRECRAPFQMEMLTVYLIRTFVRDLVVHMAKQRGGDTAVDLDPSIARSLGIGNSTGLGMAPFILNHPALFNNWIIAREQALSQVCSLVEVKQESKDLFMDLFERTCRSMQLWITQHEQQQASVEQLVAELAQLKTHLESGPFAGVASYKAGHDAGIQTSKQEGVNLNDERSDKLGTERPWHALYLWVESNLGLEAQELLVSLMLEPYGDMVDGFSHCMGTDEPVVAAIDGTVRVSTFIDQTKAQYSWASDIDWADNAAIARAWYVSEEKLEPRLGERFEEPISEYEQPLSPARDAIALLESLQQFDKGATLAEFLLQHAEHRHSVRRVQTMTNLPYGEIRDNTISAELRPIDMLRCKLSFFGAIHFDPRSDRWVRIRMFANAPYPNELCDANADFWPYP